MKQELLRIELEETLEKFYNNSNKETTLQDFVMWMLGNHVIELDFENPLFVNGKDAGRYERNNVTPKYTQEQYWAWLKENQNIHSIEDLEDECDYEDEDENGTRTFGWGGLADEQFWVSVDKHGKIKEITGYEPKAVEL